MNKKEITPQVQIESMLKKVHDRIEIDQVKDIGIHSGLSGIAMFIFYYAQKCKDEELYDKGVEVLHRIFDKINSGYTFPTFCSGIAGASWAIQHLAEKDIIDQETTAVLDNFDDYLSGFITVEIQQERSDFLHSTLGIGLYFFKRYTSKNDTSPFYEDNLNTILTFLEDTVIQTDTGITWYSNIEDKGDKYISNFSLAHGIIAIGLFLIKLHTTVIFKERSEILLKQLLDYIAANKFQAEDHSSSLYPGHILYNKDHTIDTIKKNSRLGWCYGDIGIGLLFIRAYEQLKDPNYEQLATEVFEHALSRESPEETGINDSGFCHGAFGLAYLFRVISRHATSNKDAYVLQSHYWLQKGFSMDSGKEHCEFLQWNGISKVWEPKIQLLEGYAGIGLILLDFLDSTESSWDECFLLS